MEDAQAALTHDAHPIYLFELLDGLPDQGAAVEDQWLGWDPDTIWLALAEAYGQRPSEACQNTIHALKTCIVAPTPWQEGELFGHTAVALAAVSDLEHYPHPTPGQCLFAVECMQQIDAAPTFADDVVRFWAAVLQEAGIVWVDRALAPANTYLRGLEGHALAPAAFDVLQSDAPDVLTDESIADASASKWMAAVLWAEHRQENQIYYD